MQGLIFGTHKGASLGGGAFGNLLERDPLFVLEDVMDERFTVETVRKVYGVGRRSVPLSCEGTSSMSNVSDVDGPMPKVSCQRRAAITANR